jgi:lincosamide and streptogramin A transport system ATP-binding/permease protein
MPTIALQDIAFHYTDPFTQVFDKLSLVIDTQWRTGLVGRNGRGKTTLLRLLRNEILPSRGEISMPVETSWFTMTPADSALSTREVIRDAVAPFAVWEERMTQLLEQEGETGLVEYGDLLERFQALGGYDIDARIKREIAAIGMNDTVLDRSFDTLSGGEQTRALIVALFLRKDTFPLIDEPTNHLDIEGRELLAEYLSRQRGFILVSHDRYFLDRCVDHVVSINRNDVRVVHGGYSEWKKQAEMEEEHERRRDENLQREIRSLEVAAKQRRQWSGIVEKEKDSSADSGFVSRRAAKQMKRALSIERRIDRSIEENKGLLKNREHEFALKLGEELGAPEIVVSVENATIEIGGRPVIENLSFTVRKGDRIAVTGPNGSGKTTLLRAIAGEIEPSRGIVHVPGFIQVHRAYQTPLWEEGFLRDHLRLAAIDETRFRQIMGAFGVWGDIFDRPLESYSQGQRKKVDLCRSFVEPGHLLIWDEPLNYIDLMSREQIEEVILEYEPTMLFVEHDRHFIEVTATEVVELGASRAALAPTLL